MKAKKPRQPVAAIGAMTLYRIAHAALNDVDGGDDSDPYIMGIRKEAMRALLIARRRMGAKNLTAEDFK